MKLKICMILVLSIRCYQCSTQTDVKGVDSCGAYRRFNESEHIAIECNSDESHMPGSFCMKVVQQGPRGFICKFQINRKSHWNECEIEWSKKCWKSYSVYFQGMAVGDT